MAYSLLAHLFPYIKGSQEDIATFSLQYLLTQSEKLNSAFTKRVADCMSVSFENTLKYDCQVTGDSNEKERPDMAGFDSEGNELHLEDIMGTDEDLVVKEFESNEERNVLQREIERLEPRDKEIMIMRYGLYNTDSYTQKEVADKLNISQSYISRIEKKVIRRLKSLLKV